jgi:hypothetical protein
MLDNDLLTDLSSPSCHGTRERGALRTIQKRAQTQAGLAAIEKAVAATFDLTDATL